MILWIRWALIYDDYNDYNVKQKSNGVHAQVFVLLCSNCDSYSDSVIRQKPFSQFNFFMFSLGSIAVGLEVIEEGAPLDSDSDVGHYVGNDVSDTRKCILQIQQLNRRVRELERNVDTHSVGFWSKIAFFAFTIINPILLHWLFWKRRWTQSSVQLSWKKNSLKGEALAWQMLFVLVRLWTQTVTDLWRFD